MCVSSALREGGIYASVSLVSWIGPVTLLDRTSSARHMAPPRWNRDGTPVRGCGPGHPPPRSAPIRAHRARPRRPPLAMPRSGRPPGRAGRGPREGPGPGGAGAAAGNPATPRLAPCSCQSRSLRAAARWPAALLDQRCARRLEIVQAGAGKRLLSRTGKPVWKRETAPSRIGERAARHGDGPARGQRAPRPGLLRR